MRGQKFGFMDFLALKIVGDVKKLTNRTTSGFRERLEVLGKMHLFIGNRRPTSTKLGVATALVIKEWNPTMIPDDGDDPCPVLPEPYSCTWEEFSILDGFEGYGTFKKFFDGRGSLLCFFWGDSFDDGMLPLCPRCNRGPDDAYLRKNPNHDKSVRFECGKAGCDGRSSFTPRRIEAQYQK